MKASRAAAYRVLALLLSIVLLRLSTPAGAKDLPGAFVDERRCAECHTAEARAWLGSHHDLAMQAATEGTVLGDFADATFAYAGVTTRFFRRDGRFFVHTDGPDGVLGDYEVKYVFGVSPLQQVLLELPGGRLQALSIAWDTTAHRWFHLYPNEKVDHHDELHWTRPAQNWNFMCAECHTTGFEKNYAADTDRYDSRWFRDDVGCQACHGPGAEHVSRATAAQSAKPNDAGGDAHGLSAALVGTSATKEIEACARCHARRSVIAPDYEHGRPFLDSYLPAVLEERLYAADGQIHEEVYEYGSFLQSKMASKGLRCSDCHDPHSLAPRADGNALCVTCHNATAPAARAGIDTSGLQAKSYDDPSHHFHSPGGPGSRCIDCHAPSTRYMVVDPRIDHSFRIPRPDLTLALGVPNACNGCHGDKSAEWADAAIRSHAPGYVPSAHYAAAIAAGREGRSGAVRLLSGVAADSQRAPIVRATALDLLRRYPGATSARLFADGLRDPDPLVRRTAVDGFDALPPSMRVGPLAPLLRDPVRVVRIDAARLLVSADEATLTTDDREARRRAMVELEASHRANIDRDEGRVGLANFYADSGRLDEAEAAYRVALSRDPLSVPAAVNLADLYRGRGDDTRAASVLDAALTGRPGNAALEYALALCRVRQGQKADALRLLADAAHGRDAEPRFVYVYAAALADAGRRDEAIAVLERALGASHGDRDILLALVAFLREAGDTTAADAYLAELAAINPSDPALAPRPGH